MSNKTNNLLKIPLPPTDEEWETVQPLVDQAIAEGNPWAVGAGIFRKAPDFDEWIEIMRENRRKADADPNY